MPSESNAAESSRPQKMSLGLGAAFIVMVALMLLAWTRLSDLARNSSWRANSYQVLLETQGAAKGLSDMEAGARGLLLTGNVKVFEAYARGKDAFSLHFNQAVSLSGNDAGQQERLRLLKKQFKHWLKLYIPILIARRERPADQSVVAKALKTAGEREFVMDKMRRTLTEIERAEQGVLMQHSIAEAGAQAAVTTTFLIAGLLALLLIGLLGAALARNSLKLSTTKQGLLQQIGAHKRAEDEVGALHYHNEQMLNSTTEGIIGLNPRGRITFVNPAAAELTGWDVPEMLGKALRPLLQQAPGSPLFSDTSSDIDAPLRDGQVHHVGEDIFRRKDGTIFAVEYTSTPLRGVDADQNASNGYTVAPGAIGESEIEGAVVVFRDITERQRTEMALLRLASIVESSRDAIISHMLDGTIVSWNEAAVKLYGYSEVEALGKPMSILFPRERADELALLLEKIESGARVEPYQTVLLRKGGQQIDVALTLYPVLDGDDNIMGASSNARPVTRQRREEALPTSPV